MLGVVVLRLSARFLRSYPLCLASSWLILASDLGGLSRREELFHEAWGRRLRLPRVDDDDAVTLRDAGILTPGLPVPVAVVNGLGRSETQMSEAQKSHRAYC